MLGLLAIAADGQRVKWTITGPGRSAGLDPPIHPNPSQSIPTDLHAGWDVERFEIKRL